MEEDKEDKDIWIMWKGYGKHIWMDERKVKVKIKDGSEIMNGRWKYGRYVWKFGMDGVFPQYRVQLEEEK